jgi:hypothetical protein
MRARSQQNSPYPTSKGQTPPFKTQICALNARRLPGAALNGLPFQRLNLQAFKREVETTLIAGRPRFPSPLQANSRVAPIWQRRAGKDVDMNQEMIAAQWGRCKLRGSLATRWGAPALRSRGAGRLQSNCLQPVKLAASDWSGAGSDGSPWSAPRSPFVLRLARQRPSAGTAAVESMPCADGEFLEEQQAERRDALWRRRLPCVVLCRAARCSAPLRVEPGCRSSAPPCRPTHLLLTPPPSTAAPHPHRPRSCHRGLWLSSPRSPRRPRPHHRARPARPLHPSQWRT